MSLGKQEFKKKQKKLGLGILVQSSRIDPEVTLLTLWLRKNSRYGVGVKSQARSSWRRKSDVNEKNMRRLEQLEMEMCSFKLKIST